MLRFADSIDSNGDVLAPWEVKCMGQPVMIVKILHGIVYGAFRYKSVRQCSQDAANGTCTTKAGLINWLVSSTGQMM